MKNPISFEQLDRFATTAELGSISAAARALRVSQATVTVSIANIEKQLGQKLFFRDHSGVQMTPAGNLLLPTAKDILSKMRSAIADVKSFRKTEGSKNRKSFVRLGMITQVSQVLLAPLMENRIRHHPNIDLIVKEGTTEDIVRSLEKGDLDLVISNVNPNKKTISAERIVAQEFYFIGSRALLKRSDKPVRFSELPDYPLIQGGMRKEVLQNLAAAKDVTLNFDFNSPVTFRRQLMQTVGGYTVSLYFLFLKEIMSGELTARPLREPRLIQFLYLLRRSGAAAKTAESPVYDLIKSQVNRLIRQGRYRWHPPDWLAGQRGVELDALKE
jgi:DNA-binding transcriptional LysR family regulator